MFNTEKMNVIRNLWGYQNSIYMYIFRDFIYDLGLGKERFLIKSILHYLKIQFRPLSPNVTWG